MPFQPFTTVALSFALFGFCASAQSQPQPQVAPAKPKTDAENRLEGRNRFFASFNDKLKRLGLSQGEIDAVTSFVASQEQDRELIRKAAYQVQLAQGMSDEEFAVFWNDYTVLTDSFRLSRAKALEPLKEKIKWKERPKLQAYLSFSGALSDDISLSLPFGEIWSNSFGFLFDLDREFKITPQRVIIDKK